MSGTSYCSIIPCLLRRNAGLLSALCQLQYHDTETLVDGLENNTKRYAKIMSEAADAALPQPSSLDFEEDTFDILYKQVALLKNAVLPNCNMLLKCPGD